VLPPSSYPPSTPTMVPVRVFESKWVTHGLPLVLPVKPTHSNRSWDGLCSDVQLSQVTGASALAG
jgi:hypothetical protein